MAEAGRRADGAPTRPADSELLDFLESAVREVFATMIGDCEQLARVDGERRDAFAEDRGAFVEFHGALEGSVELSASRGGALAIARGLLMSEADDVLSLEEVDDALRECANMLAGWLKSQALDPLGDCSMSVPFTTRESGTPAGRGCGALVYRLSGGEFSVELRQRIGAPTAG